MSPTAAADDNGHSELPGEKETATASADAEADAGESRSLVVAERALARHLACVVDQLGREALGLVDLPLLPPTEIDPLRLQLVGVLYWASEVEVAGLLRFVEAFVAAVVEGRLHLPIGGVGQELGSYWRARAERFTYEERMALYSRVFGGAGDVHPNGAFGASFAALVESLVAFGRSPVHEPLPPHIARVTVIATSLADQVQRRSGGILSFAARDIVAHVRQALGILSHDAIARALGGHSPWRIVRLYSPEILGEQLWPERAVRRAESGLQVFRWLADQAPNLQSGTLTIDRNDPVIRAAEVWRLHGNQLSPPHRGRDEGGL